ncbi:unnamed protein product, partial [Discosporangium mesarthrocarpum]
GSFSVVCRAYLRRGPHTGKTFVVKSIEKANLSAKDKKNLFSEVQILQSLRHPHIVDVYQFFQDDSQLYFVVIEYVMGGELFNRIVKKSFYNEKEARDLSWILLDTIKFCHDRGVVHR